MIRYKSQEHRKRDHLSHKRDCGKPPYRIPGKDEGHLCSLLADLAAGKPVSLDDIGGHSPNEETATIRAVADYDSDDDNDNGNDDGDEHDDEDDDDGSWESIDSDEEFDQDESSNPTATDLIYTFFKSKVYDSYKAEETGFETLYAPRH